MNHEELTKVQRFSFMTSWMNNTWIKTLTKMSTSSWITIYYTWSWYFLCSQLSHH